MIHRLPAWSLVLASIAGGLAGVQAHESPDFRELVRENGRAVVNINTTAPRSPEAHRPFPEIPEDSPFYDFYRRFFEHQPRSPAVPSPSLGSGFVISEDGYIITNAHVAGDGGSITVTLSDQRELPAELVGADDQSDIALLKVEAGGLPVVRIGDPGALEVGQWVLAIGSPFGFSYTATQGIISGLGRSLPSESYIPFIQTDAAVNPGSSGGPLFNLNGEVIGVNSQIFTRTGGYMGVSFAIPIDVAMDVAQQLRAHGRVRRGWLGVMIQQVTAELAQSFGLHRPRGALVGRVFPGSPAEHAGLEVGDVIVAFDGRPIARSSDLPPIVGRVRPGTEVAIDVIRDGEPRTLEAAIDELPEHPAAAVTPPTSRRRLGISVAELPPGHEDGDTGVLVEEVADGPAARAGIRAADVIVRVDKLEVGSVLELERIVQDLPVDRPIPILVQRGEGALFLTVTIPAGEDPR